MRKIILIALVFAGCTPSRQDTKDSVEYTRDYEFGEKVRFVSDTSRVGVALKYSSYSELYSVSYFDNNGVSRIERFNKLEIQKY